MMRKLIVAVFLVLAFVMCSGSQDSCQTNEGGSFVGFTALTPDQLKREIRTSVQESVTELAESLGKDFTTETTNAINEVNLTIHDAIDAMTEFNEQLEESIINSVNEVITKQVKLAVAEILENITKIRPPSPVTQPPVTTTNVPTSTKPVTTTDTPTSTKPVTTNPTTPAPTLPPVGLTPLNPATSCKQIQETLSKPPSGLYWIVGSLNGQQQALPNQVYCDMERTCGGIQGGWMKVADIDMRVPQQFCPSNFRELTRTDAPLRLCATDSQDRGCHGTTFPVRGVAYTHVCGKVIGYQEKTPNGFYPYHIDPSLSINDVYVDGISITHGEPRTHIWTFVSALDETSGHLSACRCSNEDVTNHASIPPFVGNDYFCDTGSRDDVAFEFYADDPLWDGRGCGEVSTCCSFNNPPWFSKELGGAVTDDLELRVCRDSRIANEDIPFEIVELYVR